MAVLTADRDAQRKIGDLAYYPVIASDIIYQGALVCESVGHATEGGYAKPGMDAELHKFLGVSYERADNSSGSAGDINVRVWKTGDFEFDFNGTATQADVGKPVYIYDDHTVALPSYNGTPSHLIYCGVISEYVDADTVRVRIDDAVDKFPRILTFAAAACADIARGDIVVDIDQGYAGQAADTAKFVGLGIAIEACDNSTGAAAAKTVKVIQDDAIIEFATTQAVTAYRIGGGVYADGAQAVDTAAGTANMDTFVGKITRLLATKRAWVRINMTGEASTG